MVKLICVIVLSSMLLATVESDDPNLYQCYFERNGDAIYKGSKHTTVSGRTCQRWDQQTPHQHGYADATAGTSFAEENYCRGFGYNATWCYTTDPDKRWETCDVPDCSNILEIGK